METLQLFRDDLSTDEVESFRRWAKDNYTPFEPISGLWHPIVQEECTKINVAAGKNVAL